MSSAPTPQEIASDARWLAQSIDPAQGLVRLVAMDAESYRAASFLDDRLLQSPVDAQIMPWPVVAEAIGPDCREDARWIFHIGHVGSTLLSRLLGEMDNVLAVREPKLLRDLALSSEIVRRPFVGAVTRLMSRSFAARELACVKATSFASELAPQLVPEGGRALFLFAKPLDYIGSILAGPNSMTEQSTLEERRRQRLQARGIALPVARDDAERAAAAWACEVTALEAASDAMSERKIAWLDFDTALDDLGAALGHAAQHFGFDCTPQQVSEIASGPLVTRYSKATEYEYSPQLRRDLIAEALAANRRQVGAALAMLERAAQDSPLLARALSRSTEV